MTSLCTIEQDGNEYNIQGSWTVFWEFKDDQDPEAQTRYSEVKIGFLGNGVNSDVYSVVWYPFSITADESGSTTACTNHYAVLSNEGKYKAHVYNWPGNDEGWNNAKKIKGTGQAIAESVEFTVPALPDSWTSIASQIPPE